MKHSTLLIALLSITISVMSMTAEVNCASQDCPVAEIYQEFSRMAATEYWPGYDPAAIPLAIFDGSDTWLFNHPAPPEGFAASPAKQGAFVYVGRYPGVNANSNTVIGEIRTATHLAGPDQPGDATYKAAVAIHEAFHVYQFHNHPNWGANIGELFTYPVADSDMQVAKRLETLAWERAAAAGNDIDSSSWAQAALTLRDRRFNEVLTLGQVAFEQDMAVHEGLAVYVQTKALGLELPVSTPDGRVFAVDEVWPHAYHLGALQALVLDRFVPGWVDDLNTDDTQFLDAMLRRSLPKTGSGAEFTLDEVAEVEDQTTADVAAYNAGLIQLRNDFNAAPGWSVVVIAGGGALMPQGFDPMHLTSLTADEVLHHRFVTLGNGSGRLDAMQHPALTIAAGEHPLFNGVSRVTVRGLVEPTVSEAGTGEVEISCKGFELKFSNVVVDTGTPGTIVVTLQPS